MYREPFKCCYRSFIHFHLTVDASYHRKLGLEAATAQTAQTVGFSSLLSALEEIVKEILYLRQQTGGGLKLK